MLAALYKDGGGGAMKQWAQHYKSKTDMAGVEDKREIMRI